VSIVSSPLEQGTLNACLHKHSLIILLYSLSSLTSKIPMNCIQPRPGSASGSSTIPSPDLWAAPEASRQLGISQELSILVSCTCLPSKRPSRRACSDPGRQSEPCSDSLGLPRKLGMIFCHQGWAARGSPCGLPGWPYRGLFSQTRWTPLPNGQRPRGRRSPCLTTAFPSAAMCNHHTERDCRFIGSSLCPDYVADH
jgi:hypothetical protein